MTALEARAVLSDVRYRDWDVILGHLNSAGFWIQWTWRLDGQERKGQRWYVSNMLTKDDLVRIAWQAVQAVELEETRGRFLYCGQPIFSECCDLGLLRDLHMAREEKKDG